MSRMMKAALLLSVAMVLLIPLAEARANPVEPHRPLSIRSRDSLMLNLKRGGGPEFADAVWQASILGPEYAWLLAELAQRDDLSLLLGSVLDGLARNGDPESLAALRGVVADTTRPIYVRLDAIAALGRSGDRGSLPLLAAIEADGGGETSEAAVAAIDRIDSPWLYRDLITYERGFVRFGFLLDDIESIEYFDGRARRQCAFASEEYRQVCDLLQGGRIARPLMMSDAGRLVFRLRSGREMTLNIIGGHISGIPGVTISSLGLAEFIEERVAQTSG